MISSILTHGVNTNRNEFRLCFPWKQNGLGSIFKENLRVNNGTKSPISCDFHANLLFSALRRYKPYFADETPFRKLYHKKRKFTIGCQDFQWFLKAICIALKILLKNSFLCAIISEFLFKATPHNYRLTPLLRLCLQLFRHTSQISSAEESLLLPQFVLSDEKSGGAAAQQSLCGIALKVLLRQTVDR